MADKPTAMELLDEIRDFTRKSRFLQSWDQGSRVLTYGCGDDTKAILVGSDGSVDVSSVARGTKLRAGTVRKFLEGVKAEVSLQNIIDVLTDYLHLPDERIYRLFAAWIAGTYVYSMFSHFGYLFLFSSAPRCGKTRAEEVLSHLAFDATEPRNAPTPPSMRETALAGGTAIFDTLERWKDKSTEAYAAAMELLDAGFRQGGTVSKMVPSGGGEWRQEIYPVYAPYMFAAIQRDSLTDTALDRAFQIEMVRKSTRLRTKPYDALCERVCEPLREQLYLFALTRSGEIAEAYESEALRSRVEGLGLHDRAADIWKSIFAVASVMSPDALDDLGKLAVEMSPDEDRQEEFRQLRIASGLRTLAGPEGTLTGTTQHLTDSLKTVVNLDVPDLHEVLSGWRFTQKSIRLAAIDTPRKGWEITDAELNAIEKRLR